MQHLAGRQQLAVVVAAIDPPDEAIDVAADVDRVVHGATMTPERALKRPEKADGTIWADVASGEAPPGNRVSAGL